MSKSVNILEVLEKEHQSVASVSKKNKQAIIDAYGRALTMKKVLDDFIKVNRNLIIDMGIGENANLLHGKDYSLHVSQKLSAKVDTTHGTPSATLLLSLYICLVWYNNGMEWSGEAIAILRIGFGTSPLYYYIGIIGTMQ